MMTNIILSKSIDFGMVLIKNIINKKIQKKEFETYLRSQMSTEGLEFLESESFRKVIESSSTMELINGFIIFKMNGSKTHQNKVKIDERYDETDLISYLCNMMHKYEEDSRQVMNKVPLPQMISHVNKYVEAIQEFILQKVDSNQKYLFMGIGNKLDKNTSNLEKTIEERITELKLWIQKTIEYQQKNPVMDIEAHIKTKTQYMRIMFNKFSEAHVYKVGKIKINDFYVPPLISLKQKYKYINDDKNHSRQYEEVIKWNDIMSRHNIVYVTGGPGYGKTLLVHKIIDSYTELNIMNVKDKIVIYADLKKFDVINNKSVIDFIYQQMKDSVGMNDKELKIDFLEYYLNRGDCIIMLDALDEVKNTQREEVHQLVLSYLGSVHPGNRVVITSRSKGFLGSSDIVEYAIKPLNRDQIIKYIDNMSKLGKFNTDYKKSFLSQVKPYLKKGFLNSFLILSILAGIYAGELKIPESKLSLYRKCYEYVVKEREENKTIDSEKWLRLLALIDDNTFMILADLGYPNNIEVDRRAIKDRLMNENDDMYENKITLKNTVDDFFEFCEERTELYVLAGEDDKYKFYHRSFFDYFYSQYLCIYGNLDNNEIYEKLKEFSLDSEVYELFITSYRNRGKKYKDFLTYLIKRIRIEFREEQLNIKNINVISMLFKYVKEFTYQDEFVEILISNSSIFTDDTRTSMSFILGNYNSIKSKHFESFIKAFSYQFDTLLIEYLDYYVGFMKSGKLSNLNEYFSIIVNEQFDLFSYYLKSIDYDRLFALLEGTDNPNKYSIIKFMQGIKKQVQLPIFLTKIFVSKTLIDEY